MARTPAPPEDDFTERIVDIDVSSEMQTSFLEYAYSVIYSRALPDARDGLKPVQRRILYSMDEMGVRPDRSHVKCARVVGEVMGKYHPHGDGAIYDALVRTAQPWTMRLPLIDGHGNFGSLDDGPAAMRYTECRMAPAAAAMTDGLDEDTVDFKPNYDGKDTEPSVLPAAFPNLLVNGASGIAVGMATNCPPHNLVEVVQALRHLIKHPDADVDDADALHPRPGPAERRQDHRSGRHPGRLPDRQGIVPDPRHRPDRAGAPAAQGHRGHRAALSGRPRAGDRADQEPGHRPQAAGHRRRQGPVRPRPTALRLVIEVKNGFNPDALLEQLYKLTKIEDNFAINAVALVDGQPRTLTLRDLLTVYLEHRYEVTRRRTAFARTKAADRLHLVEGLLVAILDIDDVIAIIRSSDDAAHARARLMEVFELSEIQTNYILEMPLRRLTRFSRIELETERDKLHRDHRRADRDPREPRSAAVAGRQSSWPRSPSSTARRGAPSCWRPAAWPRRRPPFRWRSPTTRAGCCCPRPGCSPGPTTPTRCRSGGPRANHDVIVSTDPRHRPG